MSDLLSYRVFVDTNVLINDYFFRTKNRQGGRYANNALIFLKSKPKVTLYIASFSLVQVISTLSKAKILDVEIRKELTWILKHFQVADFTKNDVVKGLNIAGDDVEDVFQYTICQKMRCGYILTDNVKDYRLMGDVSIIKPQKVRSIITL
jgi:predicted nucleic acid-binding protein